MSKILIIDDEKDIRNLFRELLEKEGYEVFEADNGITGLETFKKENTDMVITDIIMPKKEGLATILELRKDNPDLKIIAITGGGYIIRRDFLGYAQKFGANEVLTKPLKLDILVETVNNLMQETTGQA